MSVTTRYPNPFPRGRGEGLAWAEPSAAVAKVVGAPPEIGGKDGGTDAAWIYREAGIPMVHFSPGEGRFVLAPDARVEIDAYMAAIEALVLTFEEILGVQS